MKPILFNTPMTRAILAGRKTQTRRVMKHPKGLADVFGHMNECKQPFMKGDILWVRETWAAYSRNYGEAPRLVYKADMNPPDCVKWRPSIHMPIEAARLFLRVTDVRVERLWDIQPAEICAEGVPIGANDSADMAYESFSALWDSTIKPADIERFGWDANPWVWVYTFERIAREEAEAARKEGKA